MTKSQSSTPSIRERIRSRKPGGVVNETVDGLGEVPILRISTDDMIELGLLPKHEQSRALVAKCVVDEQGKPIFAKADEVGAEDYGLFQKLLAACYKVNGMKMKIEGAEGN